MVEQTERVCNVMEEGADDLLELTTTLFDAHFQSATLSWPDAILTAEQLEDALRCVER